MDGKPELKTWGGPLRQLKTYMSLLHEYPPYNSNEKKLGIMGVITTFSDISEDHRKLLKNEKVWVYTFEKPKQNTLTNYGG